jgi:glycolate oxidase iron-sulfur subunit
MRSVVDRRLALSPEVRSHLELCLDCRACETACPSGVQYGRLIEPFKVAMHSHVDKPAQLGWLDRLILHHLFPYKRRVRLALAPARWIQRLGLLSLADRTGITRLLPKTLQRLQAMLPARLQGGGSRLPEFLPALGPRRARVALFLGCVADALDPETNRATARVLQQNGCDVLIPRDQVCCGAIHYHSGSEEPARTFAKVNRNVFNGLNVDAVITNAAGCGAMLKDYHHLAPPSEESDARTFVSKVKDISEFLAALGLVPPQNSVETTVAYHDACHLCHAQRVREQPRRLLGMIPGLTLLSLAESELCCGAAGTYNLTQPEMSERLGQRKMDHIESTGAQVVATGNIGCILQIARKVKERGKAIEVVHPVRLLDRAYRGES